MNLAGLPKTPASDTMVLPFYLGFTMTIATTLKLPEALKARIARLAKQSNQSAHSLMIEALEREVAREERMQSFVREALAADAEIEGGANLTIFRNI